MAAATGGLGDVAVCHAGDLFYVPAHDFREFPALSSARHDHPADPGGRGTQFVVPGQGGP